MKNLIKKHILGICLTLFVIGAIMFSEMYHPGGKQSTESPIPFPSGTRYTDEAGLVQYDGELSEDVIKGKSEKSSISNTVTNTVDSVPCHCSGDPKEVAKRIRTNRQLIENERHLYDSDGWQPYVSPCGWIRFEYWFDVDVRQ